MRRFDNHTDPTGLQHLLQRVGNLSREHFLDLHAFCEDFNEPRKFGDPNDPARRQVTDMDLAQNGYDVMFAM